MAWWRRDPGPCPICGTAHCACIGQQPAAAPIAVPQLPQRDARVEDVEPAPLVAEHAAPPLQAEIIQRTLPPDEFTTATYRRPKRR